MVMEPLIPETISGVFNKTVTGPTPQNTGIHDLDTHIDRVIGQSSQQGWEVVEARNKDKREILAKTPGISRRDLIKNEDGSYRAVTQAEKPIQETLRSVNSSAMSHLKRREPKFSERG